MVDFEQNISMFWSESAIFIATFSVFALTVCSILAGLECSNQTSNVAIGKLVIKSALLLIASVVLFTLSLYVASWHSSLFGWEPITLIVLAVIWFVLSYLLNSYLLTWSGLSFENTIYFKFIPIFILISPFIIFNLFVFILGSAWSI